MSVERPRISVSICTRDHKESLATCLKALARQSLEESGFEVVIVDEGSSDGTREMLAKLMLPMKTVVLHAEGKGRVRARNQCLGACTGELVLFAADDCVPASDCLAQHLQAHQAEASGPRIVCLGNDSPPTEPARFALEEYLNGCEEQRGALCNAWNSNQLPKALPAHNISLSLAAIRQLGALDPTIECEDIALADLVLRLQGTGARVQALDSACFQRGPRGSFDGYRQAQIQRARSRVPFYRKHPGQLVSEPHVVLCFAECHVQVRESEARVQLLEASARELSGIDMRPFQALGEPYTPAAEAVRNDLLSILQELEQAWTLQGFLEGFRDQGLAGFQELQTQASEADPFATDCPRRLMAWPRWSDRDELDRLMERIACIALDGFASLVLRHDAHRDPEQTIALAALEDAYKRHFPEDQAGTFEVLIESREAQRADFLRWGRALSAFLPLGSEPLDFVHAIGAECLNTEEDVARWRRRFEAPA